MAIRTLRDGTKSLRLNDTNTTKTGYTTLISTGDEQVDAVLRQLEEAASFLYYAALESSAGGSVKREDNLKWAAGFVGTAQDYLETFMAEG